MTHESGTLHSDEVRGMFDRIAPVYDAMNRVMTAGLDRSWRRLTVEAVVQPGDRVLDACCGTGDLAVAAEREGGVVTGLGFSPRMLERAPTTSDPEMIRASSGVIVNVARCFSASSSSLRAIRTSVSIATSVILPSGSEASSVIASAERACASATVIDPNIISQ